MQDYLMEKTGQKTVPNIFVNQKHVGGKYEALKRSLWYFMMMFVSQATMPFNLSTQMAS
jgi:hypothetical protein